MTGMAIRVRAEAHEVYHVWSRPRGGVKKSDHCREEEHETGD